MDTSIKRAAEAILVADIMLVASGAGLSADSGLGVYIDALKVPAYAKRGLQYHDLCTPRWNFTEPETFYGFWGNSMNNYRAAIPHKGYEIIKKWRDEYFSEKSSVFAEFQKTLLQHAKFEIPSRRIPGPFFVYTSNVDALHLKAGIKEEEIYEIHGNIETWQCSTPCNQDTWAAPKDFKFDVDLETMFAHVKEGKKPDFRENNGFVSNHPNCPRCGDYARPSILMFSDRHWVRRKGDMWNEWREAADRMLDAEPKLKAVVLEIGAGKNVPSVRIMSERFLDTSFPGQVSVIRINRDYIQPDYTKYPKAVIGIQGTGLSVLQEIDTEIQNLMNSDSDVQTPSPLLPSPSAPEPVEEEDEKGLDAEFGLINLNGQ